MKLTNFFRKPLTGFSQCNLLAHDDPKGRLGVTHRSHVRTAVLVHSGQPGRAGVPSVRGRRGSRGELPGNRCPVDWRQAVRLTQVDDLHEEPLRYHGTSRLTCHVPRQPSVNRRDEPIGQSMPSGRPMRGRLDGS
jgi:hypothetical protein